MEPLLKSEIFFFISSIATVLLTVLLSILLFYLIKTTRNLHRLSEILKSDFKESEEFINELRERLENNWIFKLFFPRITKRRKTRSTIKNEHKK